MAKAVLTTKVKPTYDDLPEVRYHFPRTYLNQVQSAVDDWVVYYEPRRPDADPAGRGGRQAYFAVARITRVEPDPSDQNRFYAFVSDFLEFEQPVPFRERGGHYESALSKADGSTNRGAFGRAVRNLPSGEFDAILAAGFVGAAAGILEPSSDNASKGLAEPPSEFRRPMVRQLVSRAFRDQCFKGRVRAAYNETCALTGLKIINGGGNPEIEAAHIQPVGGGHNGPDSVRNGLALSRTTHWLFDRGLVTLTNDYKLMIAKGVIPDRLQSLFLPGLVQRLPTDVSSRPHPMYLTYHRDSIFKGHETGYDVLG